MDSFSIQNYFKRGKTVVLTLRQGDDEQARQWSDKDTTELLKLMNAFLPEFQNQRRRKKEVWIDVAHRLQNCGYAWTPEDCRKKWSNMIRTFKGIEEQKQDPTCNWKRVKWPFYDVMLELLSLNGSDSFPEALAVVQILNRGSNIGQGGVYGGNNSNARRIACKPATDTNSGIQHQVVVENVKTVSQHHHVEYNQESLQVGSGTEPDVVGIQEHADSLVASGAEMQSESSLDTNAIFAEPVPVKVPEPVPSSSLAVFRHSLAVKARKISMKRKHGKSEKKSSHDECSESTLQKFIDTMGKQNQQMFQKITEFQDNALTLMHQRNELLREIRDSLCEDRNVGGDNLNEECHHHGLDDRENVDQHETLTLHMGPAFSTADGNSQSNADDASQLNSTLVISADVGGTSALSTFHLEDGTVLSSIDETHDKNVLANLGPFAEPVIPEVSLASLETILHPSLVSVVGHGNTNSSGITLLPTVKRSPTNNNRNRLK